MNQHLYNIFIGLIILNCLVWNTVSAQTPLTNTFTYQGELKFNNAPANGSYDFEFSVFDVETVGTVLETVSVSGVTVTNGVFTTPITLTNDLFTGNKIWLEIGVRAGGTSDPYDLLSPRQEVTSSPYAIHAQFVDFSTIPFWDLGGNAVGVGDYIGTTNTHSFVVKVNNQKVLTIDAAIDSQVGSNNAPNIVFGSTLNSVSGFNNIIGTTISGGLGNNVQNNDYGTISGGKDNYVNGFTAVVGGGLHNGATASSAVVGGGKNNLAADFWATIPGGINNKAGGKYSFAAGRSAIVRDLFDTGNTEGDNGTFVWSDSTATTIDPFISTGMNQFLIRATGGVGIGTNDPNGYGLNLAGDMFIKEPNGGADLVLGGGGLTSTADDGTLTSDPNFVSSDLVFIANDDITFYLDNNNGTGTGEFKVMGQGTPAVLNIDEDGNTSIPGNLTIGTVTSNNYTLYSFGNNYFRHSLDTSTAADLVLGGTSGNATDDGVLTSDLSIAGSDLILKSNDAIVMSVGAGTGGSFNVRSGTGSTLLQVNGDGSVTIPGSLSVTGSVSKGSGTFKIDHPLDPKNKYLYHSFVESPDMMNVYNGNITTDKYGEAWVELPEYFEALNRDFRYQLTVVGVFAQAIIGEKITDNRFLIKTNRPDVEVSWQVTGIRQDAYAQKNRVQVVVDKPDGEKGRYLYPDAWQVSDKQ